MSATLTFVFLVWAAVKYTVLFDRATVVAAVGMCAYALVVASTMLTDEYFGGCGMPSEHYAVYGALALLPFLPGLGFYHTVGFASVAVMAGRLFAMGCVLRGAISLTAALVILAVQT